MWCMCVALTLVTRQRLLHDVALWWRHCINGRHALLFRGVDLDEEEVGSAVHQRRAPDSAKTSFEPARSPRAPTSTKAPKHQAPPGSHNKLDKRFRKQNMSE